MKQLLLTLFIATCFVLNGVTAVPRCNLLVKSLNVFPDVGLICARLVLRGQLSHFELLEKEIPMSYKAADQTEHHLRLKDEHCYEEGQFSPRAGSDDKPSIALCSEPTEASHLTDSIYFNGFPGVFFDGMHSQDRVSCKLITSSLMRDGEEIPVKRIQHPQYCSGHESTVCPHAKCKARCDSLVEGDGSGFVCIDKLSPREIIINSVRARSSAFYVIQTDKAACMDLTFDYVSKQDDLGAVLLISKMGTDISLQATITNRDPYIFVSKAENSDICTSIEHVPFYANMTGHVCAWYKFSLRDDSKVSVISSSVLKYTLMFSDGTNHTDTVNINYANSMRRRQKIRFRASSCPSRCRACRESCTYRLTHAGPVQCERNESWSDQRVDGIQQYMDQMEIMLNRLNPWRVKPTTPALPENSYRVTRSPIESDGGVEQHLAQNESTDATPVPSILLTNATQDIDNMTTGEPPSEVTESVESESEAEGEAETRGETEGEAEGEAETGGDVEGEAETGGEAEREAETEGEAKAETGGEAEGEAETEVKKKTLSTTLHNSSKDREGDETSDTYSIVNATLPPPPSIITSPPHSQETSAPQSTKKETVVPTKKDKTQGVTVAPNLPSSSKSHNEDGEHQPGSISMDVYHREMHLPITPKLPSGGHILEDGRNPSSLDIYWIVSMSVVSIIVLILLVIVCRHHC